ncbi:MAG: SAM-dependent methyltransferase [Acidobacteria bacterium]|nr:SAM-dependent methyltransferase [Acidobacteriota bacterium]MDA1234090.1 SAM-dependent methyltransferase [Acidobacteriota bacterium]
MPLNEVKPWGRSLAEYRAMFALSEHDLRKRILDCGAGPAAFNAELSELGCSVVSCDPIYEYSAEAIDARIRETAPAIIEHVNADRDRYVWTVFNSPEQLVEARLAAMQRFLADLPEGFEQGRYRSLALPSLPFKDGEFELALCSHLLFTYSEQLSLDFHLAAIRELARVAHEVRIFPLLEYSGDPSPHLHPLIEKLTAEGDAIHQQRVRYEFQRGGDQLLIVSAPARR